jgi:hypothetical protein
VKRLVFSALVVLMLTGCGPHKISAQEQARQKAVSERKAQVAKAHAAEAARRARIADLHKVEQEKAQKIRAYNLTEFKLQPLPAGVHQIGSKIFIADNAHISNLRHVCQGSYKDGSDEKGNDVDHTDILPDDNIKVTCKGSQFRFRDEAWQTSFLQAAKDGKTMTGLEGR